MNVMVLIYQIMIALFCVMMALIHSASFLVASSMIAKVVVVIGIALILAMMVAAIVFLNTFKED